MQSHQRGYGRCFLYFCGQVLRWIFNSKLQNKTKNPLFSCENNRFLEEMVKIGVFEIQKLQASYPTDLLAGGASAP